MRSDQTFTRMGAPLFHQATAAHKTERSEASEAIPSKSSSDLGGIPSFDELGPLFARAMNVDCPDELFRLFVGRAEATIPVGCTEERSEWCRSNVIRAFSGAEVERSRVVCDLLKRIFNFYFKDELYGAFRSTRPILLSSGAFDETVFGLPVCLKDCLRFSVENNWYGYSHSHGRFSAREALAELESQRFANQHILPSEIVVTMGGTWAVASIADFLSRRSRKPMLALCAVPNYPPLLASVSRRFEVRLVATPVRDHSTDIDELISMTRELRPSMVLLQTVTNPTGLRVDELKLRQLINEAPDHCYILLDEAHDCFGKQPAPISPARRSSKVITINSLSKRWAAPGLKIGWMVLPDMLAKEFYEYASSSYGGPGSVMYLLLELFARFEVARIRGGLNITSTLRTISADYGLTASTLASAFDDYVHTHETMVQSVRSKCALVCQAFSAMGADVIVPECSVNVVGKLSTKDSYISCREILCDTGVSVYPGLLCCSGSPGIVRISPCIPEPQLSHSLDKLSSWFRSHAS